jgi:hypothetical protein
MTEHRRIKGDPRLGFTGGETDDDHQELVQLARSLHDRLETALSAAWAEGYLARLDETFDMIDEILDFLNPEQP